MRNIDSIPVTASIEYLGRDFPRHLERILIRNNWIVIYPEQELWQNYRKIIANLDPCKRVPIIMQLK